MAKKGNRTRVILYFLLLGILLLFLILHSFKIIELQTDFFTRYLIALVFVLLLLPMVPKIKIFDIVEVKRDARILAKKK